MFLYDMRAIAHVNERQIDPNVFPWKAVSSTPGMRKLLADALNAYKDHLQDLQRTQKLLRT